jgi:exosortase A
MATISDEVVGGEVKATVPWAFFVVLGGLVLGLLALYAGTAGAIYDQWATNETYAHGFLIVPISLWLVWEKRAALARAVAAPALAPLLLLLPLGLLWLLAHIVDVAVIQQYALVAMIVVGLWAMLGHRMARFLAFPLGFLLLAVPVGEGLIPPMMNFTADFTVGMLRLTGIPVYRDGLFFSIPSGDWSVVAACSGIRYLLASVTLGVLYAYLTYSRTWKRLLFVLFSIGVPIVANGLRAYMIVMIAHLSDMKLATGVDHLVYGWVFFGIVITIMFAVGAIWRDPVDQPSPLITETGSWNPGRALTVAAGALLLAAPWAVLGWGLDRASAVPQREVVIQAPQAIGPWVAVKGQLWDWSPQVQGADGAVSAFYRPQAADAAGRGADAPGVGVYIGVYRAQRAGAELVQYGNRLVAVKHPVWGTKAQTQEQVEISGRPFGINRARLESRRGEALLVWQWFQLGSLRMSNPVIAKLAEAWHWVSTGRRDGAWIAVSTPMIAGDTDVEERLRSFIADMSPSIEAAIEHALSDAP